MSSTTSLSSMTSPRSTVTSSVGALGVSAPLPDPFKNGSTLSLRPQVSKCLHFLKDAEVLFCSAPTTLTRASLSTRVQSHVYASNDATCITALAVSPDCGTVAWAEFTYDCRVVVCTADLGQLGGPDAGFGGSSSSSSSTMGGGGGTMEGVSGASSPRGKSRRSRRVITCLDTAPHQPLTCLAFSGDGKHLLIPSAPPHVTLHCIAWEAGTNGRLVAHGKGATGLGGGNPHPIVQVDTHPKDHTRMAVSGKGTLRQFKLPDASAKNAEVMVPLGMDLKEVPSTNFTCHAWVGDDHLVACTLEGGVYVFEGTTLKRAISHPRDGLYPGPQPIHALLAFGGGFVTGCEGGLIRVYEKADVPSHLYKVHGSFVVENVGVGAGAGATLPPGPASRVTALAASPNQDDLGVVVGGGGAYLFPLGSYELAKKAAVAAALKRERDASGAHPKPLSLFRPLLAPFLPLWPGATGGSEGMSRAAATASLLNGSLGGPMVITSPLAGTHFQPLAVNPVAALSSRPPPPTGLLGVSIALRRPLAVTISSDKTLRVWNLSGVAVVSQQVVGGDGTTHPSESPMEHKSPSSPDGSGGDGGGGEGGVDGPGRGSLSPFITPAIECIHALESMPTSVALHPMGDTALVSTDAFVGVYNLRLGGVKCLREVPLRGVSVVRFCGTGGMWAAAGNGGIINVYQTYGGGLVGSLKGHKEAVVGLVWGKEDRSLASVSKDGTVILWAITVPNAVSGGSVPPSSKAAFSNSVVVSAEALRAEGTVRPSVLQLAFKAVSVVENENLAPTALAFGPGEGEVVVAGIIKDGSVGGGVGGRGGKGVKFNTSASQTVGGAASDAPDPTGPVLIRLYMLQLSDEKGRVSGSGSGSGGAPTNSSASTSATSSTLSSLSKSLGGAVATTTSTSSSSSSTSKQPSKRRGSTVGLMNASAFMSRLVLPVQGGAPIRSLETLYVNTPGSTSPTTPTPLLFAGLGHRIPDAADSDLRAQLFYTFSGQTPPQGATPAYTQTLANAFLANAQLSAEAHLLPPLTKALTARDPVGGVRAYRFPLISAHTSGAAFSPVPSKPEAPLATHPLGYFEKGGMKGHGGPCVALASSVGEGGHVWSVGADGGFMQWCVDGEAIGRVLEAVKGSSGLAVAATNALALAVAVGNGEVAPNAAAAAVSARSSPPSLGNPLGGGAQGSNWLPWSDTIFVGGELLATLERSRAELTRRLKELNAANKHAARVRETELRGAMEDLEEKYEEELLNAREATEESRAGKQDSEGRGAAAMAALEERQGEEGEAVRRTYAAKLAGEEARCERKGKEKAALVAEEEARLEAVTAVHAQALADLKELQEEELEVARDELRCLVEAKEELESAGRVKEGLLEVGLDNDLEDIRAKLEVKVLAEAKATAGLRGENALIKQRFGALHTALEKAQGELDACGDVEAGLEGRIKGLEKDHATLMKELGERDAMLEEKNVRILEVKRRTQELEKFKFVLNYKIQELKRAVMPRKRDIANLRVTLGEMESELLQVHKSSSLLGIMVGELGLKKAGCDRARAQAEAAESHERERLGNIQRDMVSLWDLAKEAHRLHALSQAALAPPPLSPGGGGGQGSSRGPSPPRLQTPPSSWPPLQRPSACARSWCPCTKSTSWGRSPRAMLPPSRPPLMRPVAPWCSPWGLPRMRWRRRWPAPGPF